VKNDREVILDALRKVASRLSLNRALQEIAFAAGVVLFALAVLELVRPAAESAGALPVDGMLLLGVTCFGAYALWRALRRASLAQAAGAADYGAQLRDELKSACWFLSQNETTPFVEAQIARAARSAQALEPGRLVPLRPQRGALAVAGLAVMLFASTWVTPRLSHSWDALTRAERPTADAAAMRARLDELQGLEAQRVAQALDVLERQDSSGEERQRAAREVRDAAAQADMRAAAARETLERLAVALEGRGELARALQQGRAGDAAELLRDEVTRSASAADGREAAPGQPEDVLERLLREIAGGGMENDREVQQRTLRVIEDAEHALRAQREIREIERQMQDFYAISAQRSPYSPGEPDTSPPPEAGHVELHSGGTSQLGARLRLKDDESMQEGSGVGAGYGESPAMALEGAPSARLDVELQLETVQVRSEGGGAGEDSWFFAPSREQAARAGFAAIRERGMHARAEVVGASGIPLRQRGLVRDYFVNLHESEKP
jgi:hypothetical protein